MQKNLTRILILCSLAFSIIVLTSCGANDRPTPDNPVTLTMWHVYGSQTKSPLNASIEEFNHTIGKEEGITINVVSVTSSSAIDQALLAATNQEPGAESLPDLFTAYPRVVEIVGADNLLPWDSYFSESELSKFKEEFLQEGYFDDQLLMLPVAKSTEAFYLNQTLFDRFTAETGVDTEHLKSYDDIFDVAKKYYDWSGGKHFFQLNDFYHYAYVGMQAAGKEFIKEGKLQTDNAAFRGIWMPMAECAIYGGICLDDGYAASRWKTAEIIANIGSSADVLYQPEEVIYEDNTTEKISVLAMPYPLFGNGKKHAVHRGGGLFAIKSEDERKNYAAAVFAKWLTEETNNLKFVTDAGYLPVTEQGLDTLLSDVTIVDNEKYHSIYKAVAEMTDTYMLHALPLYEGASATQQDFEAQVKLVLRTARQKYLDAQESTANKDALIETLARKSWKQLNEQVGK